MLSFFRSRAAFYVLVVVLFLVLPLISFYFFHSKALFGTSNHRRLTFIAINDTYRIDGVSGDSKGGLHRVRTLREWVERSGRRAVLIHAGDFLAPSLVSDVSKGEHMIKALNRLDGDPDAFDERMFVVFGNHEFDHSTCSDQDVPLVARVRESKFRWLNANLKFSQCNSMNSLSPGTGNANGNVKDTAIFEVEGVRIGLFGIGLTPDEADAKGKGALSSTYPRFEDEQTATARSIQKLKDDGAKFIVAVTHLPYDRDQALIDRFVPDGLNMLVGGHDHNSMALNHKGVARAFKADSDARTAWVIDVDLSNVDKPLIFPQLVVLDKAIPPDRSIQRLAETEAAAAETIICEKRRSSTDSKCLTERIGWSQTPIDMDENINRSEEIGFGNWLADRLLESPDLVSEVNERADVAIVGAGSLGLNENMKPGELQLRFVEEAVRYDGMVLVRKFPARIVCDALIHGFSRPGSGAWPHVGGVRVKIDQQKAAVTIDRFSNKILECDGKTDINVAAVPYLLCGGDEYPFNLRKPEEDGKPKEDVGQCQKRLTRAAVNEIKKIALDKTEKALSDEEEKQLLRKYFLRGILENAIGKADAGGGIEPRRDGRVDIRSPKPARSSN